MTLVESVSVASIAYAVGSVIDMTKLVVYVEVSFIGLARMYEPSGACLRVVEECMRVDLSSRIEDKNAFVVVFACCITSCRYLGVSPMLVSLMFGSGNWSGDWTNKAVLHQGF